MGAEAQARRDLPRCSPWRSSGGLRGHRSASSNESRQLELVVRQTEYVKDIARAFHLNERSEMAEAARSLGTPAPRHRRRRPPGLSLVLPPTAQSRFQPRTVLGHTDSANHEVYHVEFSPRGDMLASCGQDGTIRLWDLESGRLLRVLRGHKDDVNWVAFSPDGSKLGTGGDDGTVRLWDLSGDGDPSPVTLGKHDNWVTCVLFTPDGRRLISTGRDGHVNLWDVQTGSLLRSFIAHPNYIEGMAISVDGHTFATASADSTAKLWDLDTCQERFELVGHDKSVQSIAFSHSGNLIASVGHGGEVRFWDPGRRQALAIGYGHTSPVQCVAFSPNDRLLATCGDDASIRIWDVQTALPLRVYHATPYRLWCVAFSRDGRTLASCGDDGGIRLWDVGVPQDRGVLRLPVTRVDSIALPPGADELIVAGPSEDAGRDRVKVSSWNLRQCARVGVRQIVTPREVSSSILSEDGKTLATQGGARNLELWDLATGSPGETVRLPDVGGFSFSGFSGPLLLLTWVKNHSMEPLLLDLGTGRGSLRFRGDIQDPSIVPRIDGKCLVIASSRSLFRWDLAADMVTRVEQPHDTAGSWMNILAISPRRQAPGHRPGRPLDPALEGAHAGVGSNAPRPSDDGHLPRLLTRRKGPRLCERRRDYQTLGRRHPPRIDDARGGRG